MCHLGATGSFAQCLMFKKQNRNLEFYIQHQLYRSEDSAKAVIGGISQVKYRTI